MKKEQYIAREELQGVMEEVQKDLYKIQADLDKLISVIYDSNIMESVVKLIEFANKHPDKFSKSKLKDISRITKLICEKGKKEG